MSQRNLGILQATCICSALVSTTARYTNLFCTIMLYLFLDCVRVRFTKRSLLLQQTEEEAEKWSPLAMSTEHGDHELHILASTYEGRWLVWFVAVPSSRRLCR